MTKEKTIHTAFDATMEIRTWLEVEASINGRSLSKEILFKLKAVKEKGIKNV